MTISTNIKKLKKLRNLSQAEIARLSGLTQPTVLRIISGEIKDPGASKLKALKKGMNVTYDQLIDGKGIKNGVNDDPELYSLVNTISENPRTKRLCEFIEYWMNTNNADDQAWFEGDFKRHNPDYDVWLRTKESPTPSEKAGN